MRILIAVITTFLPFFALGLVLGTLKVGPKEWQYWALWFLVLLTIIANYAEGMWRGIWIAR